MKICPETGQNIIYLMKVSPETARFWTNLHQVNDISPFSGLTFIR
jgi:hypothetical protein